MWFRKFMITEFSDSKNAMMKKRALINGLSRQAGQWASLYVGYGAVVADDDGGEDKDF